MRPSRGLLQKQEILPEPLLKEVGQEDGGILFCKGVCKSGARAELLGPRKRS